MADERTEPPRPPVCEGCHGMGGNWDCEGENDPDDCNCYSCTGYDNCPECDQ